MKNLISCGVTALLLAFAPISAQAQSNDADTCGLAENPDLMQDVMMMMLGPWQVNHQSGYVVVGGMTMPFPNAGENDVITFERSGNDLIATHPDMQEPMVFHLSHESPWSFQVADATRGVPPSAITAEDLEQMSNCHISDMPALIGTTSFTMEGITMDFTWRMVIVDTEIMFAVQHIEGVGQGYPYFSRRTVRLSR